MSVFKRVVSYLIHDRKYFLDSCIRKIEFILPVKLYLSLRYRILTGSFINWHKPTTFTEKIQWLKLYSKNDLYTFLVDKISVKEYVKNKIGNDYIIPTLEIWNSVDDINFDKLPDSFVLKTTHGGGGNGVIVCTDKKNLDQFKTKKSLSKSLKFDIYKEFKEWPYKCVRRRVFAEKFMSDNSGEGLTDYKFFCFNGIPKYCQVIRDRYTKETIDFYDMQWNHQPFVGLNPKVSNGLKPVPKPHCLQNMIALCEKLSENIPFVRVDSCKWIRCF